MSFHMKSQAVCDLIKGWQFWVVVWQSKDQSDTKIEKLCQKAFVVHYFFHKLGHFTALSHQGQEQVEGPRWGRAKSEAAFKDCISNAQPEVHKTWINVGWARLGSSLTLFWSFVPPYPLSCVLWAVLVRDIPFYHHILHLPWWTSAVMPLDYKGVLPPPFMVLICSAACEKSRVRTQGN